MDVAETTNTDKMMAELLEDAIFVSIVSDIEFENGLQSRSKTTWVVPSRARHVLEKWEEAITAGEEIDIMDLKFELSQRGAFMQNLCYKKDEMELFGFAEELTLRGGKNLELLATRHTTYDRGLPLGIQNTVMNTSEGKQVLDLQVPVMDGQFGPTPPEVTARIAAQIGWKPMPADDKKSFNILPLKKIMGLGVTEARVTIKRHPDLTAYLRRASAYNRGRE